MTARRHAAALPLVLAGTAATLGALAAPASAATSTLVPGSTTWRVLDTGADVTPAFALAAYDDTAAGWKDASTTTDTPGAVGYVLGYGDADVATPALSFGGDSANKHVTTYFRKAFTADPTGVTGLALTYLRDDGVVIYLNGVEVGRDNMPAVSTAASFSTETVDGAAERALRTLTIDPALLRPGRNVLAVELHQRSAGSSDIAWRGSLAATTVDAPPPVVPEVALPGLLVLTGAGAAGALVLRRRRAA